MDLLILGASTRAAAFSAIRIGLRPTCVDLFADADLVSNAIARQIAPDAYPEGLAELTASFEPMPWLYTGGLENRPDLVDRISTRHRRLGNPGSILRSVRDPVALASTFREAGLDAPRIQLDPAGLPVDGSWLRKPLASAGGRGIKPWLGQGRDRPFAVCYQERIDGLPLSALFVGDGSKSRCFGITRQFIGKGPNRFAYRGSLAPWPVPGDVQERVERLGEVITARFGLVGLFGIDIILVGGRPWPIEVNPRYTASVETLEWSLGRSLLAEHLSACGFATRSEIQLVSPQTFVAKAIIFASRAMSWPIEPVLAAFDPTRFPEVGDVPQPGSILRAGDPVLTVFARGSSAEDCRAALATRLRNWRRRIRSRLSNLGVDHK